MTIYNNPSAVPPKVQEELIEGLVVLGRKLREWRAYAEVFSLTAEYRSADDTAVMVTCHEDDRVVMREGTRDIDLSLLLDKTPA